MTRRVSGPVFWRQVLFGIGMLAVLVFFLLTFSSILLPFVAGMALAYFLDPVADRLEKIGLSRMMATTLILVSFVVVFALSLMLIIPVLIGQLNDLIHNIPDYVSQLQGKLSHSDAAWVPGWLNSQISSQMAAMKDNFSKYLTEGAGFLGTLLSQLWNSGKALLDIISLLVVTPVVAFYLLLDWDRMIAKLDSLIPRNQVEAVREIARDMDHTIAGFVRGQGSLCIILGIYYAVGLSVIGINFGLLIGFFTGMISFIPYVGSTVGLIVAVGMAAVQYWPDYIHVIITLVFFFSGQFLEGNVLQPKLVGSSVGLHPVWLMFAMFAFGALFGFLGVLVAVPCAAAVGVLVRFAVRRYLASDLYYGEPAVIVEEKRPQQISEQ
ncbi:AI-2E family transporter [Allorhizobium sp. BGMRC 0089]|uniref:AI-2E family transporter n=1 Tax=Allorhizobium sonneratiae TaxID=2934936 RepID=UPI00203449AE|nr:AI-2E family transporter [Allorhizobium sonneratiae]MCM2292092.1 AI-2E family transporter [Allorhizobium sonneratiae]